MAQGECNDDCCPIYNDGQLMGHIKQRNGQEKILGTNGQFCAAFYHVHEWGGHHAYGYHCLDSVNCEIGNRARGGRENVQPKEVIAFVKFEVAQKKTLYEARYSNCEPAELHAEDFFIDDVQNGELAEILEDGNGGKITMYLTYQPCNKSVRLEGTTGTPPDKSCCKKLKKICTEKLRPKNIRLCLKVTHLYRVSLEPATGKRNERWEKEILRNRAIEGAQNLMGMDNVSIEHMTQEDWNYLSGMTVADVTQGNAQRRELDASIQDILTQI